MPVPVRPPMPRLPPFALAERPRSTNHPLYLLLFAGLIAALVLAIHLPLLSLPFFWDEQGQFVPTALDLLRHGQWIAHSTTPNVHPPGLEAYLVLWYKAFGFSILTTRLAMLLLASLGVLLAFLLAIDLTAATEGAPAFLPPLLLLASPLFYTQSMMAQLDMPAMVFTLLALLFFVRHEYYLAAGASVVLVMTKETGVVVPLVFFVVSVLRREWRRAALFLAAPAVLFAWLVALHRNTGYWLGNPGFAHYNVTYSLQPVRIGFSLLRHLYYIFIAEFRWIGSIFLLLNVRRCRTFRGEAWRVTTAVACGTFLLVSVLGGAELERYLLPVLPIFYIAVTVAIVCSRRWIAATALTSLLAGLIANLFWTPPYPFPFENNLAMVKFVRLQQVAAEFTQRHLSGARIATAWPYSKTLENPDFGYVRQPLRVVETNDFHPESIRALPAASFNVLIAYTRTWAPEEGVISIPIVREFLSRFYEWQPDISADECFRLGLAPMVSWNSGGQKLTIYTREEAALLR